MIALKIDVKKLDKSHFFTGKTAVYADLVLKDNKDGTDQYGNDGFIVQSVSKEARARQERGPIVGNWKHIGTKTPPAATPAPTTPPSATPTLDDSDIPF